MKSSSQRSVSQVFMISLVLVASLILFVSRAAAQEELGTVKTSDGGETTTVRDTTYGSYGRKVTTRDSKGRVTEEKFMGSPDKNDHRDVLEKTDTVYETDGGKSVHKYIYRLSGSDRVVSETHIRTDALGGLLRSETHKFDEEGYETEGVEINVDNGVKTTRKYDPKTRTWEVEPEKKEEPKKVYPPATEDELKRETLEGIKFELFGGFAYMRAPDETAKNLFGFNASLFYNFTPHVAVGGDFSALGGSTTDTIGTIKSDTSLHRQTYLFGPEFRSYLGHNFTHAAKWQAVFHPEFGWAHDSTRTTIGTATSDFSANAFAMSFGGGMDYSVNPHLDIRIIQADVVPTHFGGDWQYSWRVGGGVVVKFGEKK